LKRLERYFWLALALFTLAGVLLVYWRVLGLGWSYYDDPSILKSVEESPWYLPGKAAGLPPVMTSPGGVFRPVQFFTFKIDLLLWGRNPLPLHALSLLLHAGSAFLLAWLLFRLTRTRAVAFVSSLLFISRVNPQTVGWISAPDALCLFFLLASACFLALVWEGRPGFLVGALVCYALALGSKEPAGVSAILVTLVFGLSRRHKVWQKALVVGTFWLFLVGFCVLRWHLHAALTGEPRWFWQHTSGTLRFYVLYLLPYVYVFFFLWLRDPLAAARYYLLGPLCSLVSAALLAGGLLKVGLGWRSVARKTGYLLAAIVLGLVTYLFLFDDGTKAFLPVSLAVSAGFLALALTGEWRGVGWLAVAWTMGFALLVAPYYFRSHGASRFLYIPDAGKTALLALACCRYGGWWRRLTPLAVAAYVFHQTAIAFPGFVMLFYP